MSNDTQWQEVGGQQKIDMWDENAGDKTIIGQYVKVRTDVGRNKSNIFELKLESGDTIGVWGSTVLDGRFESILPGSMVKIEFLGKTAGKDAKGAYKNYLVHMKPAETAPETKSEVDANKSDVPF